MQRAKQCLLTHQSNQTIYESPFRQIVFSPVLFFITAVAQDTDCQLPRITKPPLTSTDKDK